MASKPTGPEIEFDPRKDVENLKEHGISLARATDMEFEPHIRLLMIASNMVKRAIGRLA